MEAYGVRYEVGKLVTYMVEVEFRWDLIKYVISLLSLSWIYNSWHIIFIRFFN